MVKSIKTEDYYIATIDLLGMKKIINQDNDDSNLNRIRNIYTSWKKMIDNHFFPYLTIKFYSDNVAIAIKADASPRAADYLLEYTSYMAEHMLRCGYKPRGGVCKGKFYIDDVFVWGKGLVDAYNLESKVAKYPRIIVDEKVVSEASEHLKSILIQKDEDGLYYLNYLRSFGRAKTDWVRDISGELDLINNEIGKLNQDLESLEVKKTGDSSQVTIMEKLLWLRRYVENNLEYWKSQLCD